MPKNEDGEFELILGNRQLLSVFFIVVILLGVFFTMGYIVGRNSGTVTAELTPVPGVDARPTAVEAPAKAADPAPSRRAPPETAPQQPAPAAERDPEPPRREPKAEARTVSGSHPSRGTDLSCNWPPPASTKPTLWWMYCARKTSGRLAAEIDEKPGTFRVLVGPITDTTANKMRADLQGAGFPGNAAIRRTF